MDAETKNILDIIFQGIQLLLILISAIWAYFRFRAEDPLYPRIEFGVDCKFFGPQENSFIAAVIVSANNRGNVEHRFSEIRIRMLGIKANEKIEEFKGYAKRASFPVQLIKGENIIPASLQYFFVRPGVNQTFNYATVIPDEIRFIVIRATFKYERTDELHTAENVFEVKAD